MRVDWGSFAGKEGERGSGKIGDLRLKEKQNV